MNEPASVREAKVRMRAHYTAGCDTCSSAHGIASMCRTGADLYAAYLRADAAFYGIDESGVPSLRWHNANRQGETL